MFKWHLGAVSLALGAVFLDSAAVERCWDCERPPGAGRSPQELGSILTTWRNGQGLLHGFVYIYMYT